MIQGTHFTLLSLLQAQIQWAKWDQSYLEGPLQRRAGCKCTQQAFPWKFISTQDLGVLTRAQWKNTKPMSPLLVHSHEICPLAATTLSFPTEKGGNYFFIALLGHARLSREALWSKGGCDATLINDHHVNKWRAANAAMEWNITIRPECKWRVTLCLWALPELHKQLWWLSRDSGSFASLAQAQPSRRWAAAGAGTTPGALYTFFEDPLGSTSSAGRCEELWGWDARHLWPSFAPCGLCGWQELT